MYSMQSTHCKHYTSLPRCALGLPKLRIEPRTERTKRHVLAHALTAREAADMLDCLPGEVEALVTGHILVGRNVKTSRGHLWIVCAACAEDKKRLLIHIEGE